MRRKLVAGNWKMNGSRAMLVELDAIAAAASAAPGVDVSVAVPFTLIAAASERVPNLAIGAEDVHEAGLGRAYRVRVGGYGEGGRCVVHDRRPFRAACGPA
ncbi:triosephosphate isomerase [Sphingomonas faeni]|nr:triosephosphate isomerase [Sphingomonas faeni]